MNNHITEEHYQRYGSKKKCSKCKEFLDLECFLVRSSSKKHLLRSECIVCCRKKSREKYKATRESKPESYWKQRYKRDWELKKNKDSHYSWEEWVRNRIKSIKHTSKKRNLEFNMTKEMLLPLIPKDNKCPILRIEFDFRDTTLTSCPTVDRIDNSKGYVEGNLQIISHRANSIKRDATWQEIMRVAEYLKNLETNHDTNNL